MEFTEAEEPEESPPVWYGLTGKANPKGKGTLRVVTPNTQEVLLYQGNGMTVVKVFPNKDMAEAWA